MRNVNAFRRAAVRAGLTALVLSVSASWLFAQSIKVGSKEVQVHGSFQQGFGFTDDNNFLTMDTTDGSGAMTDAAINVTSRLTSKLRLGGQLYVRNIGELGNGRLEVDWAFADYKFTDAFGVRGGKIKTMLGLYTDTQDMEFLHTWALLPQGTYPLDLRSVTIAHVGADVYGSVKLGKAGTVAYTAYLGVVQDDRQGGYRYGLHDTGMDFTSAVHSKSGGLDARWTTPVNGLMAGYSYSRTKNTADMIMSAYHVNFSASSSPWWRQAAYADYQASRLHLSGEFRHELQDTVLTPALYPETVARSESWFGAASYRVFQQLEVGSYYSHFVYDTSLPVSADNNHINDKAVTARVDVTRFWHVKIEGHFMDGNGSPTLARGFYVRNNTSGFQPKTNMLVIRTGVNF